MSKLLTQSDLERLPYSIRFLLENVARCSPDALESELACAVGTGPECEAQFIPNRLKIHDTTCLPALADFAGMPDLV
ncbi:hypothetical protein, partial [Pseudomonas syringae group genomosp. 7]|uniref:hypothetical protein n=1 Tax=Pseudomonas syringae group genomosp. 7 TaxID=251699 RepID=UPI00376F4BA6